MTDTGEHAGQIKDGPLGDLGYTRVEGNRFTRQHTVDEVALRAVHGPTGIDSDRTPTRLGHGDPWNLVIDVLAPGYLGRLVPNQVHGDLVVDEVPGLGLALARPGTVVDLEVTLTSGQVLRMLLTLPDVLAALCLKTYAYVGRLSERDATDVWRLLEAAWAGGVRPVDWDDKGTQRDARAVLHQHFGSAAASGAKRATAHRPSRARIAALVAEVAGRPAAVGR